MGSGERAPQGRRREKGEGKEQEGDREAREGRSQGEEPEREDHGKAQRSKNQIQGKRLMAF